jgi:hypothetical protein
MFRGRVDLSTVTGGFPPITCQGIAYSGWPTLVVGATGSGKTLVCRWLLFQEHRDGRVVGHADQEMGQHSTRAYYESMGATPDDLAAIAYWDLPSPRTEEAREFLQDVLDSEVDVLLWDKMPDFLRGAGKAENDNDAVNEFMAGFIEPIQDRVTSILIDATGHDGRHSRGASEKDFKVALAWLVEVIDEPKKDHVGRVRWTCTKDRFGGVGRGTTIEFSIGGDGNGKIVGSVIGISPGDTTATTVKNQRLLERESDLRHAAAAAGKKHAPDEAHAVSRTTLMDNMGVKAADKGKAIDLALAAGDEKFGMLASKPNPSGRGSLVWWRPVVSRVSQPTGKQRETKETDEGSEGSEGYR